jgi:hypothetical protein
MSDTPETDANAHNVGSLEQPHYVVDVEIAQDLERRLKASEAENAALREALEQAMKVAIDAARKE